MHPAWLVILIMGGVGWDGGGGGGGGDGGGGGGGAVDGGGGGVVAGIKVWLWPLWQRL